MDLITPTTLQDALALRAQTGARVFAGGTDLFPERATRRAWGDMRSEKWLDLSRVPGLKAIERNGDWWRFGALVTWADLMRADLPAQFDGYRAAARDVGGLQIQNRGTLVGNLCTASPAGDGAPCLIALDAEVELMSVNTTRRVPVAKFIAGRRKIDCEADEIVTAIYAPARDRARGAFRKLGARRYLVISIAMASALIETAVTGRITHARIVIGACSERAQRLNTLEAAIAGELLSPALGDMARDVHFQHLAPIDDVRSSAIYRREAAKQLVREMLTSLSMAEQDA